MKIYIEYSANTGNGSKFNKVCTAIREKFKQIEIEPNPCRDPRPNAFEVTAENGVVIWSSISSGRFPGEDQIVERVQSLLFN